MRDGYLFSFEASASTPPTYPDAAGFKVGGTSQAAAQSVDASRLRIAVLDVLASWGDMTADQCARFLGESVLSIRPRFSELRAKGLIADSGMRAKNDSGRSAVVWRLT